MKLYHGSPKIVSCPRFGEGRIKNDYGQGFYCTEEKDLASEWAVNENRNGYVNEYDLQIEGLNIIDLNTKDYNVLHWLTLLINNRDFAVTAPVAVEAKRYLTEHYLIDISEADVIKGYRADDSYFSFARDFINNTISIEQLSEAMTFGKLGEQIVLKSAKSFEQIRFIGSQEVDACVWYPKKESRDRAARENYYNIDKRAYRRGETYIVKLLDEEI